MSASGGCAGWVLRKASRRFFGGSGGGMADSGHIPGGGY